MADIEDKDFFVPNCDTVRRVITGGGRTVCDLVLGTVTEMWSENLRVTMADQTLGVCRRTNVSRIGCIEIRREANISVVTETGADIILKLTTTTKKAHETK